MISNTYLVVYEEKRQKEIQRKGYRIYGESTVPEKRSVSRKSISAGTVPGDVRTPIRNTR